ncbi:ficolin-2-like [Pocillopora damicornis]|uniref:ficolin-2-like n=1 Tax=Pocillopora damicornis TaxID=46731 RepID=UPI000F54CFEB|nr:ficolin-2-like [Pocillopora damicornis]
MAMKSHAIKSAEVPNEGSCRVMCLMEPNCVSINVGPVVGRNQKCELNNATEENHAPIFLVNNPGYTYLAIEVSFELATAHCRSNVILIVRLVFSGNSGDSLAVHRGMPFTTKDQDNDHHGDYNCAIKYEGAWWYERCHRSNLNDLYLRGQHSSFANGVNWKHWKGQHYSLKRTEMKIRPVDF